MIVGLVFSKSTFFSCPAMLNPSGYETYASSSSKPLRNANFEIHVMDCLAMVRGECEHCWYFLMNAEEFASVQNYHCSLHPEVFRVSYFPQGKEVLSSS